MGQQVGRVGEPGAAAAALPQQLPPPPPPGLSQPQARGLRGSSGSAGRPSSRRREAAAAPRGADSGFNIFVQHGNGPRGGGRERVGVAAAAAAPASSRGLQGEKEGGSRPASTAPHPIPPQGEVRRLLEPAGLGLGKEAAAPGACQPTPCRQVMAGGP